MSFLWVVIRKLPRLLLGSHPFCIEIAGSKILVRPRTFDLYIVWEVFVNGVYEVKDKALFKNKPALFVDLGANIGSFSIWAAKEFDPSNIVSVEMEKENYDLFNKSFNLNGFNAKTDFLNAAVYEEGTPEIGVDKVSVFPGMNKITTDVSHEKIGTIAFRQLLEKSENKIVDYLKIDIEGSEKFLFTDAHKDLFRDHVRYISMESHTMMGFDPLLPVKYLEDLGYEVEVEKSFHIYLDNYIINAHNVRLDDELNG